MTDTASPVAASRKMPAFQRVLGAVIHFARTQGTQPSTWRGVSFCLTALGIIIRPDLMAAITAVGMAVSGLIGVLAGPDTPPEG